MRQLQNRVDGMSAGVREPIGDEFHGPDCQCKDCVYYNMQNCPECGDEFFPAGPTPLTAHPEGGCENGYPPCGCTYSRPVGWWRK